MLKHVMIVTDEDGTELVFGPFAPGSIDRRVEKMQQAFPHAHVRSTPLLSVWHAMIEGQVNRT